MIAIIADLHMGVNNHNKNVFEEQMLFFEKQFFPYIFENDIKHVICCGDFFHNRNVVDWVIFNELKQRFFDWLYRNHITFHAVIGNHDAVYRTTNEVNSLSNTVTEFPNVNVYTAETIINIKNYTIGIIPWIINPKSYKFPKGCDMLFGHLELKDFPMVKGITSKDGFEYKTFKPYKHVFSGHYHINSTTENVHMVGTPYQLTWNDFDEKKGFYVLDSNYGLEYIENNVNAKYVKLYYNNEEIEQIGLDMSKQINQQQALEIAKNHYCRLFVNKSDNPKKLDSFHSSLLAISHNSYKVDIVNILDVIEDIDLQEFDEKFAEGESTIELIKTCITDMTFESSIDKDFLLDATNELYKLSTDEAMGIGE